MIEDNRMRRLKVVGDKLYGICDVCHKLVQFNKTFFGSLHFCLSDEEIKGTDEKNL